MIKTFEDFLLEANSQVNEARINVQGATSPNGFMFTLQPKTPPVTIDSLAGELNGGEVNLSFLLTDDERVYAIGNFLLPPRGIKQIKEGGFVITQESTSKRFFIPTVYYNELFDKLDDGVFGFLISNLFYPHDYEWIPNKSSAKGVKFDDKKVVTLN